MDPFSIALGAGNIAGGCGQAAVTILKLVGDIRTADTAIRGFCDEINAFRSTYEGLTRSLETPILLEAARVASKTPDKAQLWDHVRISLGDSLYTTNRINQLLDQISQKGGNARELKTGLEDHSKDGELYRLRQRVQFVNAAVSSPVQTMGLMLQLEQRAITTDYQLLLEAKLTSLEHHLRYLLKHPEILATFSGATLIVGTIDGKPGFKRDETYLSFAKKMLLAALKAASARSSPNPDFKQFLELSFSEPRPQHPLERERTIPDWMTMPETVVNDPQDTISIMSPKTIATTGGRRLSTKSTEVAFKLTQQHLKLGQERAERNEHDRAERSFKKALELLAQHDFSGRISFQPAEVVLLLSKSCLEQRKFDDVIDLLHPIAAQQSDFFPPDLLPASASSSTPAMAIPGAQVPDSLQALAASHLLGEAYKMQGDLESAKEHAMRAFLGRIERLGDTDQKTWESVGLLIEIFQLMGDEEEAEAYQVFLSPTSADEGTSQGNLISTNMDAQSSQPMSFDRRTGPTPTAPTLYDTASSPVLPQRKPSMMTFTRRLMSIAWSSYSPLDQHNPDSDDQVSPLSRFGRRDSTNSNLLTGSDHSEDSSSLSESSLDRTDSIVETVSSSSSICCLERTVSTQVLESEFLAIKELCTHGSPDQAVKIALKFLEGYGGHNFVIRRAEMEKNIRKGSGEGLTSTGMGYSPLHYMCELKQECVDEVRLMLKYGADVNAIAVKAGYGVRSNAVLTPLQLAIDRGHTGICQLLLETPGIRTDVNTGGNWYPLLTAGRKRQYDTVRLLLKHGPSSIPKTYPDAYYGSSPLHDAAKHCDLSLVEILLEYSYIDPKSLHVDVQDKFGKTALMHAIIKTDMTNPVTKERMTRQRREVIEALLQAGADTKILDREGRSAKWYAEKEDMPERKWLCELIGESRYEMMA